MSAQMSNARTAAVLRRDLFAAAERDRTDTAEFLALIAEFDASRLYVPEGYSSMHAFCVGELRMCEDSAYKRIQAGRAGWKYPQLFAALSAGKLHLSAIFLLSPHLTPENVDELVAASTHQSKRAIRDLIARRVLGPAPAFEFEPTSTGEKGDQLEPVPVISYGEKAPNELVPPMVATSARVGVHCTVDREKLDRARALLSHCVPSGKLDQVLDRALEAVIRETERRTFGQTERPRSRAERRPSSDRRRIPAHVKREVWQRDDGRCTFVGTNGHRCGERRFLEFDHIRPVARGGEATVEDLRLCCRAHNQYEAERLFGAEFMAEKREAAQLVRQVASGLRNLGCRADEARRAAEVAVATAPPDSAIEDVLRSALRSLAPPRSTRRDEAAVGLVAVAEPLGKTEVVAG